VPETQRFRTLPTRRPARTLGAVALAGLVALTGCGGHRASAAHGVVPWVDQPVEGARLAQSATSPTCTIAALDLPPDEQHWGGAWNGAVSGYFMVENAGHTTCELPVPSRVTAVTPSGRHVGFAVGSLSTAPPVVLDPGERLQAQVSSPYGCGKDLVESSSFGLSFPSGTLQVPGAHMAVQCGGTLVDFSGRGTGSSSDPGATGAAPVSRLRATMSQVPAAVAPGGPVTYTVTLTNPTARAVALSPCPSYQEGIKGQPSAVHTYQLNCGAARRIGPHSSVRFAMQLPLPSGLTSGPAVVDWKLQLPLGSVDTGQFTSAGTRIR
jgi:hypothetical protein